MEEEARAEVLRLLKQDPFDAQMEYELEKVEEGCVTLSLYMREDIFQNSRGAVHGGVLYGLSDTVMGSACFSIGKSVTTMGLQISYLRPAKVNTKIRGIGKVRQAGRRIIRTECEFYDEEGHSLAHCEGTFFVLRDIRAAAEVVQ